ncbi:jg8127 [Pararge aegeria aegeria]|uniref:Jg8127 protein n=2 Tax=Pararge aegeria TaxID=116150 RepID=A0A8S4RY95_9NEOP|nr:jg8127 [Pararge aegeria aegeria]
MSSTSPLECNEDLENVTLVRMEDVQPHRNSEAYLLNTSPYINRMIDHDYSCVFNDEDSNIGSMVSIHSEEVEDLIENQVLENDRCKTAEFYASNPDSWPTLEILPGGVIKHSEKYITSLHQTHGESDDQDLMYACAKCPQRFKFLYNLVKHVKLHEEEKKKRLNKSGVLESKPSKTEKMKYNIPIKKKKGGKFKKCKVPKK